MFRIHSQPLRRDDTNNTVRDEDLPRVVLLWIAFPWQSTSWNCEYAHPRNVRCTLVAFDNVDSLILPVPCSLRTETIQHIPAYFSILALERSPMHSKASEKSQQKPLPYSRPAILWGTAFTIAKATKQRHRQSDHNCPANDDSNHTWKTTGNVFVLKVIGNQIQKGKWIG